MRVAALDLGSNTSLMLIADVNERRLERVLYDGTNVTRMGQGVHANRRFHPEALKRLDDCLHEYAVTIQCFKCEKVMAVATSAARDVSNGHELVALGKKHGIPVHIIPGTREAELTFLGAVCDRSHTSGIAVIDVGGGSTEVICDHQDRPRGTSVDVGSVRLTEMFLHDHPVPASDLEKLREYAAKAFELTALPRADIREVVAVAGTPTTLAALELKREFDEKLVHGFRLSLETIDRWTRTLAPMSIAERERLPGMQPKRADVVVAGAAILACAVRALGKSEVTVSTRGVRYGVALAWQDF